jgi:hypothetical protein
VLLLLLLPTVLSPVSPVPLIAPVVPEVLSVAEALSVALTVAESDSESEPVGAVILAWESLSELLPAVDSVAESDIEFEPSVTLAAAEPVLAPVLVPPSVAPPDAVLPPASPQAASVIVMAVVAAPQIRRILAPLGGRTFIAPMFPTTTNQFMEDPILCSLDICRAPSTRRADRRPRTRAATTSRRGGASRR